jgi:hypothetical protein
MGGTRSKRVGGRAAPSETLYTQDNAPRINTTDTEKKKVAFRRFKRAVPYASRQRKISCARHYIHIWSRGEVVETWVAKKRGENRKEQRAREDRARRKDEEGGLLLTAAIEYELKILGG